MDYKGYTITRAAPEKLPNGKKRGVIDIHDQDGRLVKIFTYTLRNWLGYQAARAKARLWVDTRLK